MPNLDRVYSGKHINDQSVYHSDDNNSDDLSLKDDEKPDTIQEARGGIVSERNLDLEKGDAQQPELETSRTAGSNRSRHDPKLVSIRYVYIDFLN